MQFGLLGRSLAHSLSPQIHRCFGDYPYALFPREPEDLPAFFADDTISGFNVTIPYKIDAFRACDALSETARAVGAVNTVIRRPDGTLFGDNTDAFGFRCLAKRVGVSFAGKKVLVLGSGGASRTVQAVLHADGAAQVIVVSRTGEENYQNLGRHRDTQILVNATPVGMFPANGLSPVSLDGFDRPEAVLDLIYNPMETALLRQARERGIPHGNGLAMLVAQALPAARLFSGRQLSDDLIEPVIRKIEAQQQNIVLIGMPGCGKSTVGRLLAERTGKALLDTDAMVEAAAGCTIPALFAAKGEAFFRDREAQAVLEAGKQLRRVIATGGGSILKKENRDALRQNGVAVWLRRDVSALPRDGRPLSKDEAAVRRLMEERQPIYESFADHVVDVSDDPHITTERVIACVCSY